MKFFIRKCLSLTLVATIMISVCCFGSGVGAAASSDTQNVIRIIVDEDTFNYNATGDNQQMYCMIHDVTTGETVSPWITKKAKMEQIGDPAAWSYDLDAHGITLDAAHTYLVIFADYTSGARTKDLLIEGYDSTKDYTAVFTDIYTSEAFTAGGQTYLYKWIGDNEFNVGLDIISINVEKVTFWQSVENMYCHILDETAEEMVIESGRMTKEYADTWSFDLGKHGVVLNPAHTYTVVFHDGGAQTCPLTISAYDRSCEYTALFTGRRITDIAGGVELEFVWSKDDVTLYGDADRDGKVTIQDATAIQRVLADMYVERFNEKAADVDGGGLTIADATMIQRYLADMIDRFPVENEAVNE